MEITAQLVKELREKSGAGMMECKKALSETNGNLEDAFEHLRKLGLKASAGKAARMATDGIVAITKSADGRIASLVEINCETDFVAKNDDFIKFANDIAAFVCEKNPQSVEQIVESTVAGQKILERLNELVAKIGEKISIRRFKRVELNSSDASLGSYIHLGNKIGVLVSLKGNSNDGVLKDVAMHIAAVNPQYLVPTEIPASVIEKEKEISRVQLQDSGKPAEILEKILLGKIAKFASEICLNEQIFIKDPTGKKTVAKFLKEIDAGLTVDSFVRFQVGDGMEKKQEDFAAEVAKMVK